MKIRGLSTFGETVLIFGKKLMRSSPCHQTLRFLGVQGREVATGVARLESLAGKVCRVRIR